MKKKTDTSEKQATATTNGLYGVIGKEDVEKATALLKKYKESKTNLENRIIDNEQWFKMRHWEQLRAGQSNENASAWLFNSIANKHADAMDNFPMVSVLPREASDSRAAGILSQILPVVFERNEYEQTYNQAGWYHND